MITCIKDVAREAGVSTCTVSRILNEAEGFSYNKDTRKRVGEAARRMAYVPSQAGRAMRLGKTFTIALVSVESKPVGNYFNAEIYLVLYEKLMTAGYELVTHAPQNFLKNFHRFSKNCDGVVAVHEEAADVARRIRGAGLPLVEINTKSDNSSDRVEPADFEGGKLLGAYLADLGYKQIVFFGNPEEKKYAQLRFEGIKNATEKLALKLEIASLDKPSKMRHLLQSLPKDQLARTVFIEQGGYRDLLGIYYMAVGMGLAVPRDLGLASCHIAPTGFGIEGKLLSGLSYSLEEMASQGAEMLLEKLENGGKERSSRSVPYRLHKGQTVARRRDA